MHNNMVLIFEETFSPIARFETIRIVLALAAQQQWSVYQFDVKSAFLNGELQEEVYVEQPEGFVKKDSEEKVYKLTKALYGLKQAPRAWYSKIDGYFQQNGFKRRANEPTLYVKKGEVCQTDGGTFISQKKYAKDLLKKFGMINCKLATTPMNVNEKLQQNDGLCNILQGIISEQQKRVMQYIAATIEYGIWYLKFYDFKLCEFTDSDWASSLDDRRSVSANVFTLGSGVITWSSKKQATVALSSSKAEYAAATSAACQSIWLRRMLTELQHEQEGATVIFSDNKATISMTKNPTFHSRTKHIDIRFHFIRGLVAKEEVSLLAHMSSGLIFSQKLCQRRSSVTLEL
ncbi:Retrovirus-related Pol polyprotein from transposon TNT 1-94 [Cucumis melo var. makuwa]|uniref:Retrovirus-related Pol polyprotein from transposon TNT 1-94 n=1 Tax=Cucumis melo var. makuwa TaxID=1194695 RepID=A0A5D3BJI6_CUCMM|nr:Retrovirus-related Pol polyprotein from transposon TNT 1-94 [Cucumis melo var. makuwa]TYJ99453.1 Retrovirus-related Pol polyprotein from transposon TNT 1-94 [Cucumis melo var. makuwa]